MQLIRFFANAQNDRKREMSLRSRIKRGRSNLIAHTVIARRSRSNPIFNFLSQMKLISVDIMPFKFLSLTSLLPIFILSPLYFLLTPSFLSAQTAYNLEVIFKKTCESTTWYEGFGFALSTAGDVNDDGFGDILIGSPTGEVRGRCYLYFGGNPMDTLLDMALYGDTAGDGYGVSVCSGYLNNDLYPDIVVGIPNGWINGLQPGKVYVYFGGPDLDSIPDKIFPGQNNAESFGISVICGDVNGNGGDDLIVGAYAHNGFTLDGRVYVYYGGALLDTIPDVVINGHNGESMGITVGSGGDVNSDGFEDIVAGAFNNDEAGSWAGKVYVFLGGNPMDTVPDCWLHGEGAGHCLGWQGVSTSIAAENYDMAVTCTQFYPNGFPAYSPGKVYILFGGSSMDTLVDLWKVGETDSSGLGVWVAGAKVDANTMYGDFLSGAPDEYQFDGRGYLWIGNNSIDSMYDGWLQGNSNYYGIGWRVACAGDVNGDGYDEVIFSNYAADSNQTVWVCQYTGPGIAETRREGNKETGRVLQIYPNPFTNSLDVRFQISDRNQKISIKIFDVAGKIVRQGEEGLGDKETRGQGAIRINTEGLPSGVYFVEVRLGDFGEIKKVVKIR